MTRNELKKLAGRRICDICLRPIDIVIDGEPIQIKTRRKTEICVCQDCMRKTQKGACKDA